MISLLWMACVEEPSPTVPVSCHDGELELTCGAEVDGAFVPLEDGNPLTMVHGPAGGWSFHLAVSAAPMGPFAEVLPTITFGDTEIDKNSAPGEWRALVHDPEQCVSEDGPLYAYIDPIAAHPEMTWQTSICALAGQTLRVTVDLTELLPEPASTPTYTTTDYTPGRAAQCSVEVVAVLDELDVEACAAL